MGRGNGNVARPVGRGPRHVKGNPLLFGGNWSPPGLNGALQKRDPVVHEGADLGQGSGELAALARGEGVLSGGLARQRRA